MNCLYSAEIGRKLFRFADSVPFIRNNPLPPKNKSAVTGLHILKNVTSPGTDLSALPQSPPPTTLLFASHNMSQKDLGVGDMYSSCSPETATKIEITRAPQKLLKGGSAAFIAQKCVTGKMSVPSTLKPGWWGGGLKTFNIKGRGSQQINDKFFLYFG